jgi:hypothetical protein
VTTPSGTSCLPWKTKLPSLLAGAINNSYPYNSFLRRFLSLWIARNSFLRRSARAPRVGVSAQPGQGVRFPCFLVHFFHLGYMGFALDNLPDPDAMHLRACIHATAFWCRLAAPVTAAGGFFLFFSHLGYMGFARVGGTDYGSPYPTVTSRRGCGTPPISGHKRCTPVCAASLLAIQDEKKKMCFRGV